MIGPRYEHPAPVFGCEWCPHIEDVFATACQDSFVRVFRYRGVLAPLYKLAGHTARAFNVAWSPLLPGLLASSSDDHLVFIWEVLSPSSSVCCVYCESEGFVFVAVAAPCRDRRHWSDGH
jgi:WD40 repeat protein